MCTIGMLIDNFKGMMRKNDFQLVYNEEFNLRSGENGREIIFANAKSGMVVYASSVSRRITFANLMLEADVTDAKNRINCDEYHVHLHQGNPIWHMVFGVEAGFTLQVKSIIQMLTCHPQWYITPTDVFLAEMWTSDRDIQFDAWVPGHTATNKLQYATPLLKKILNISIN